LFWYIGLCVYGLKMGLYTIPELGVFATNQKLAGEGGEKKGGGRKGEGGRRGGTRGGGPYV
jgi:hypothetical protein